MRNVIMQEIFTLAEQDPRVCFVGSDLGFGVMHDFAKAYPERIFREGISEQHAVGMASGLALEGKRVYVNTIAAFLLKRCYEQISLDLCVANVPVCLVGNGGGVLYAPLGPTHLIPEDIGILRPLPNMTIIVPCDAREMARLVPLTKNLQGPSYIRIGLNNCSIVSQDCFEYQIGKAINFTPQQAQKTDILFITTGMTAQIAVTATKILASQSINATVLHYHTVKPFDAEALCRYASQTKHIISIEEHSIIGGLGSAVGDCLLDTNILGTAKLHRIALPDKVFSEHGSRDAIVAKYGISLDGVLEYITHKIL